MKHLKSWSWNSNNDPIRKHVQLYIFFPYQITILSKVFNPRTHLIEMYVCFTFEDIETVGTQKEKCRIILSKTYKKKLFDD